MTLGWIVGLGLALQVALMGIVFWWMPLWGRPELHFGVTVPATFRSSDEGRRALGVYRRGLLISLAVSAALAWIVSGGGIAWMSLATTTIFLVGVTTAYLAARNVVRPHAVAPTTVREAALQAEREPFALGAFALPFALLLLTGAALSVYWPNVPDPMPMRVDGAGEVLEWGPKRIGPIVGPLIIGVMMCAMMPLLGAMIFRGVRRPDASRAEAVALHRRRLRAVREALIGGSWLIAAIFALLPFMQLSTRPQTTQLATIAVVVLAHLGGLAMVIWLLVRHGSAFTATTRAAEAAVDGAPIGDRSDDRFWKWGAIYYNPDDPAVWVEKRIGIGYTCNFAQPAAWWTLGAIIVVPIAVILIVLAIA